MTKTKEQIIHDIEFHIGFYGNDSPRPPDDLGAGQ